MEKDNFISHIEKEYNSECREYSDSDIIKMRKAVNLVGKNKKVLDVGCSTGFFGNLLTKRGNEVYGVDIAEKALEEASGKGIKTTCADLEKSLPFPETMFDCVTAIEVIEHLKDTDNFLEEIRRVLRPSGYLVLTTSNFVSFGRRVMYLMGKSGYHEASYSYPKDPPPAGHLRYYNKGLMLGFLTHHHFRILSYTSDVIHFSPNNSSFLRSTRLAEIFPTLGRSLIVKAVKN